MARRTKAIALLTTLALGAGLAGCSSGRASSATADPGQGMVAMDSLGVLVFRADAGTQSTWTPYAGRLDPPSAPDTTPRLAGRP